MAGWYQLFFTPPRAMKCLANGRLTSVNNNNNNIINNNNNSNSNSTGGQPWPSVVASVATRPQNESTARRLQSPAPVSTGEREKKIGPHV